MTTEIYFSFSVVFYGTAIEVNMRKYRPVIPGMNLYYFFIV